MQNWRMIDMKINIAVCDDEEIIRKQMSNIIIAYFSQKNIQIKLWEFEDGHSLLNACNQFNFSFIFLDIDLGKHNGVEVAKKIRDAQSHPINIIFVTNYIEYQSKVFSIHTFDYLLKPITKNSIFNVLDDLMFWYNSESNTSKERITFKTINGLITIYIDDLLYLNTIIEE